MLPAELLPAATRRRGSAAPAGLLIGVDGGATKTIAATFNPATGQASAAEAGPSNPEAIGLDAAASSINSAIMTALSAHADYLQDGQRSAPESAISGAVLGIAGINNNEEGQRLLARVPSLQSKTALAVTMWWPRGPRAPSHRPGSPPFPEPAVTRSALIPVARPGAAAAGGTFWETRGLAI